MSEPLPRGVTPDVARGGLPDDLTAGVDFAALDRWPLPTEPDRQAHDAADLLLLDTLAGWIASVRASPMLATCSTICSRSMNARPASAPPASSIPTSPPWPPRM